MKHQAMFKLFLCTGLMLMLCLVLFFYGETGFTYQDEIVLWQLRFPKIVVALLAGGLLGATGLILQIFFQNPLAGPDLLGINSGASLGVALSIMGASFFPQLSLPALTPIMAMAGAMSVFFLLNLMVRKNIGQVTILILGLLIASFTSSLISILINLSSAMQVKNYLVWSMGTFQAVTSQQISLMVGLSFLPILALFFLTKTLNLMAFGDDYASSMGLPVRRSKMMLMLLASFIIGLVTVYCGPIGFIGIIAPHLARSLIKNSDARVVLPLSFMIGSCLALLTELILVFSGAYALSASLSTNAMLGIIGAPVIAVYLLKSRKLA